MDVTLYVKEEEGVKVLQVPKQIVRDLLRDRLSQCEVGRIHRLARKTKQPAVFKPGSVLVDFSTKEAQCFQAGLNMKDIEPTWEVQVEKMGLENY